MLDPATNTGTFPCTCTRCIILDLMCCSQSTYGLECALVATNDEGGSSEDLVWRFTAKHLVVLSDYAQDSIQE